MTTSFLSSYSSQLVAYPNPPLILVAYSGGVDSEFLLEMTVSWARRHQCLEKILAVYVHHGISKNADLWAQHCQDRATQLGVKFVVEHVTLSGTGSVEQDARQARYAVFARYLQEAYQGQEKPLLLTAHHQDDQVETLMLALKRGSGPTGLSAMAQHSAFSSGILLRTMLDIPRAYIEEQAKKLGLTWVEDESNADTHYDRNFFRHEILPPLKKRFTGWNKAVCRSAQLCTEQNLLLDELLSERLQQAWQADDTLPFYLQNGLKIDALLGQSRYLQAALIRAWLQKLNSIQRLASSDISVMQQQFSMPSRAQLDRILDTVIEAKTDANPCVNWNNVEIRRYKSVLYAIIDHPDYSHQRFALTLDKAQMLPYGLGQVSLNSQRKSTQDLSLRLPLEKEQVTIRFGGSGLSVRPQGRQGKRKIKKLYQEYQVPSWMRTRLPLLFYGEQLVAMPNLFVVEGFQGTVNNQVYFHFC